MSIKSLAQGGVESVFKILKELVQDVTITETTSEYNPSTGLAEDPTSFVCPVLFAGTIEKDSGDIKRGDREMFVKVSDVLALNSSNELRTGMTLVDGNQSTWLIVSSIIDPTGSIYQCIVRRSR